MKDKNLLETIKLYGIRYIATIEGETEEHFSYFTGKNKNDAVEQLKVECSECNMDLIKVISAEEMK